MGVVPWGRQIAVAMTPSDEQVFMTFVRGRADVAVLRASASTKEGVWLEDLTPRRSHGMDAFYLWNRHFPWVPDPAPTTDRASWYLPRIGAAPVIEYVRDPLRRTADRHGRLYWAKSVSPDGSFDVGGLHYAYDFEEFERWYASVVRWVRKGSTRLREGSMTVHCLPDAARVYGL